MTTMRVKANPPFRKNERSPIASYSLPVTVARNTAVGTEYIVGK
jgi:hypothetical protein